MKKYIFNLLISLDQWGNTLIGGDPDETISSRLAKLNRKGNKVGVIGCKILDKFEKGHCEKSLEKDEGKDQTFKL
jgi:hypothetical protein